MQNQILDEMVKAIRFAGFPEPSIGTDPDADAAIFWHEPDHAATYRVGYDLWVSWNGYTVAALTGGLYRNSESLRDVAEKIGKMADIVAFLNRTL